MSVLPPVRIEGIAHGGDGLATLPSGKKVFVAGAAPGDLVRVELVEERGQHARGRVAELLERSPDRVAPPCAHVERCGGCPLQHLSAAAQLRAKESAFYDALARIGGIAREAIPDARPIVPSPEALGYRIRCRLHLREGRVGYLARASHELVAIERCHLLAPALEALALRVGAALRTLPWVREVELCVGADGAGAAAAHLAESAPAGAAAKVARRLEGVEGLRGVVVVAPPPRAITGPGRRPPPPGPARPTLRVFGDPVVARPAPLADGVALLGRPDAFAQANAAANERLVRAAVEGLSPSADDEVLELYAGAGNFTFALAARAARVTAVEEAGVSLDLARRAAAEARVERVRFVEGDAARVAEGFAREGRRFALALLDPPRAGAKGLAAALSSLAPRRIAYVSCEPSTLARDVAALAGAGYRVRRAVPVDMFPQTHHVEGVVILER